MPPRLQDEGWIIAWWLMGMPVPAQCAANVVRSSCSRGGASIHHQHGRVEAQHGRHGSGARQPYVPGWRRGAQAWLCGRALPSNMSYLGTNLSHLGTKYVTSEGKYVRSECYTFRALMLEVRSLICWYWLELGRQRE